MAEAAAAIEEELEALEAMYPDDGLMVRRAGDAREDGPGASTADEKTVRHTMVSLDVAPRTLDDETQQYVRATLCITLDDDYPANPPTVRLSNVRGLDDTRQAEVRRRLDDACRDFSSDEPVLALLCETAFETLTELNRPDGDCAFCLAPVADADDADASAVPFIKLMRCYHCFHENCFARWWRWRAAAAAEASAERGAHHEAASESEGKATPPTHLCPVCRVAIEEEDVRHVKLDGGGTRAPREVRGGDGKAESQRGPDRGRRGRGNRVHAGRARVGLRAGTVRAAAERRERRRPRTAAAAAAGGGRAGARRCSGRAGWPGVAEKGGGRVGSFGWVRLRTGRGGDGRGDSARRRAGRGRRSGRSGRPGSGNPGWRTTARRRPRTRLVALKSQSHINAVERCMY